MPNTIPRELQPTLNAELHPFERILFSTQPIPSRVSRPAFFIWFFAIPWTAFSVFWIYMASEPLRTQADDVDKAFSIFFPMFGLPFVLVGLAMLSSPFWAYLKAQKTYYIITNERAMVVTGGRTVKIESIAPERMKNPTTHIRADGSGDIIFGQHIMPFAQYRYTRQVNQMVGNGFYGLPRVTEAKHNLEKMLQEVEEEKA